MEPVTAPYGQVMAVLADANRPEWHPPLDFALVWTLPELAIPTFNNALVNQVSPLEQILAEVETFARAVINASRRVKWLFVTTWVNPPTLNGGILGAWHPGRGSAHLLARMNARLAELLAECDNIHLLDSQPWAATVGRDAFSDKLWYQGKVPFAHAVFQAAVKDLKAALRGLQGQSRKLVVINLDDTLWGGLVGEVGWETLQVGGQDAMGEAYLDFQKELKSLSRQGIALGIISKNDEATALAALRQHPQMELRPEDFAGWRINWGDKARNLADLAAELRQDLASVVFIDSQPAERARVREALPEVLVPDWPENPQYYKRALRSLKCFENSHPAPPDRAPSPAGGSERWRPLQPCQIRPFEEWLRRLNLQVKVEKLGPANLARAAQLLNQASQMNLAGRRMTEAELHAWAAAPDHGVWVFRVSDRFSDAGLAGLASLKIGGHSAAIVDFVLHRRVLDRKIGETMLHWLVNQAQIARVHEISAEFQATGNNEPGREFWQRSGFHRDGATRFFWNTGVKYPLPDFVQLAASYHNGHATVRPVIEAGQTSELVCRATEDTVRQFIALTGDNSPLHADPEFARRARHGGILVHGMCPVLFLSALDMVQQPGRRVMFRKLSAQFHQPVYPGDAMVLKARISECIREVREVEIAFSFRHQQSGREATSGLATFVFEKTTQETAILAAPKSGTPLMVVDPLQGEPLLLEQISRGAVRDFRFQINEASLRACYLMLQGAVANFGLDYESWRWRCDATSLLGSGLISTFVGQCLPGSYGVCRNFDLTFHQPLEKNQPYRFIGKVVLTSPSTASVISQITIADTVPGSGIALVAGKIHAGVQPPPA